MSFILHGFFFFFFKAYPSECDSFKGQDKNKIIRGGKFSSFWSVFAQEGLLARLVKDAARRSLGHSERAEGMRESRGQIGWEATLRYPLVSPTSYSLFRPRSPRRLLRDLRQMQKHLLHILRLGQDQQTCFPQGLERKG